MSSVSSQAWHHVRVAGLGLTPESGLDSGFGEILVAFQPGGRNHNTQHNATDHGLTL